MAVVYVTRENEVLDYICWNHYHRSPLLNNMYLEEEERNGSLGQLTATFDFTTLTGMQDSTLGMLVQKVLEANPGLIERGVFLPAGLSILLPDIEDLNDLPDMIQLWD